MAELLGVAPGTHLEAILAEYKEKKSIYGYPERKLFRGFPGFDFSVDFHDRVAATPLGPASGPHTQLAQNILLAFLGGGRIMELKTVQILDRLEIPRPCINAPNVGYNVEWSQELRLEDSYREYVIAWMLLKWLEELEVLGIPKGDPFYHTVFDISVGYDLKGIASPQIQEWLAGMRNAEAAIEQLKESLPGRFSHLKKVPIDPHIADSATLSTFHGCPREEIESIVEHLISEHRLNVIVKMNPTILGFDFVRETLQESLGYRHIELDRAAFEEDLQFEEGVAMMKRLESFAARHQRRVGAKFTNTLVVKNNQEVFKDEVMYLSGPPLHVLSMNAMHRFRKAMGDHFHISFSAGISKHNFAEAVSCNMKPITTCTDLLKTGGYTRMFDYLKNLKTAMEKAGTATIADFIIQTAGPAAGGDLARAGMLNAEELVPRLTENPRYHFAKNQKDPPKIDSHLELFDCITCNKCLPVCPNAANFSIPTGAAELPMTHFRFAKGEFVPEAGETFTLEKGHQIANLADFCNECGDCDTYCPEYGGPFIEKPRFFFNRETYQTFAEYDGFYFPEPATLKGRIDGKEYSLAYDAEQKHYTWRSAEVELVLDGRGQLQRGQARNSLPEQATIDTEPFYIMKTLLDGLLGDAAAFPSILLRNIF